jgi:hydrogenase/urease accessory protein HupE
MKRAALVLVTACLANISSVAAAHPGHGTGGENHSLVHYLTEPAHVVPMLSVAVLGALAIVYLRGRLRGSRDVG